MEYSHDFLIKKAYEIGYALFRVGAQIPPAHSAFVEKLENRALEIIDGIALHKFHEVKRMTRSLEHLLRIGGDTGIMNSANSEVIIAEIGRFDSAVAELINNSAKPKEESFAEFFSSWNNEEGVILEAKSSDFSPQGSTQNEINQDFLNNPAIARMPVDGEAMATDFGEKIGSDRLPLIFERIKQNGNCKMKEIQEVLPDISERTIRYDLQKLLEQGLIERVGGGGPATYYRVKEESFAS